MTGSDVLLDTWAWWEMLFATEVGARLRRRYLGRPNVRVHSSVLALAEIGAKLAASGEADRIAAMSASLKSLSRFHDVSPEIAQAAGPIRAELRRRDPNASLVDALVLCTARRLGARLVSSDRAFKGLAGVVGL